MTLPGLGEHRWVRTPLAIYAATRLFAGILLSLGARTQPALISDHATGAVKPASPGYLGVVTNWDGEWFQTIAEHGYPSSLPRLDGQVVPNEWAFTPGYPFLVRAVMWVLRVDFPLAATMVSLACGALAVTVLYGMARRWMDDFAAAGLVLGLCCFPAAPVLQVAYAESLALLLVVLSLAALTGRRYGWLVLCAALLAITRPILLPLALLGGLVWLARWRRRAEEDFPVRERWVFASACISCAALVGVWPLVAALVTGDLGAFTETMGSWRVNKAFGGASVNWLTLALRDPLEWGMLVAPIVVLTVWTAFRRPARAVPGAARWWGPVYMLYILAATKPNAGLLRHIMLAIFPMMPLAEKRGATQTRRAQVLPLVLVASLGLIGQYYWVMYVFTVRGSSGGQLFP